MNASSVPTAARCAFLALLLLLSGLLFVALLFPPAPPPCDAHYSPHNIAGTSSYIYVVTAYHVFDNRHGAEEFVRRYGKKPTAHAMAEKEVNASGYILLDPYKE